VSRTANPIASPMISYFVQNKDACSHVHKVFKDFLKGATVILACNSYDDSVTYFININDFHTF